MGWVKQPLKLGVADLKPDYEPGSFGFDPLGLYPKVGRAKVSGFDGSVGRSLLVFTSEDAGCVVSEVRAWNERRNAVWRMYTVRGGVSWARELRMAAS